MAEETFNQAARDLDSLCVTDFCMSHEVDERSGDLTTALLKWKGAFTTFLTCKAARSQAGGAQALQASMARTDALKKDFNKCGQKLLTLLAELEDDFCKRRPKRLARPNNPT